MPPITRFEEIAAWQKARMLTQLVYQVSREGDFARDYGLRDQMRRSAVSVMANIAEGFERGGNAEFRHFLAMAKGSTGEVKSHLYVALDAGFILQEQFDELYALAGETEQLIGGFIRYLSQTDLRGPKYR